MLQESNSSGPNFSPTSPPKTLSPLTKHRNSTLLQISKRKRETLLQEKRLQNLDKLLQGGKSQAERNFEEIGGSLQNLFEEIGQDENGEIRRDSSSILSEIVFQNEECLMKILKFVKEGFIERGWILANLTKNLNFGRITKLVECGILDCFVEILDQDDVESVGFGLEGIMNVLKCGEIMANCQGERRNLFMEELQMNGGIGKIDDLQWSENEEIHRKAERILDEFFTEEEEEFYEYDYEISIENE